MIASVFADGGVILKNPSVHGGTFAFVLVDENGQEISHASGTVTPSDIGLPTVSNNYSELLACVNAMLYVPQEWDGTIYTDSFVTMCRLTAKNPGMKGIPKDLRVRTWEARLRLGAFKVTLLDGHPTKDQLFSGIGKRGNPVSRWNDFCDRLCKEQARKFMANIAVPSGVTS